MLNKMARARVPHQMGASQARETELTEDCCERLSILRHTEVEDERSRREGLFLRDVEQGDGLIKDQHSLCDSPFCSLSSFQHPELEAYWRRRSFTCGNPYADVINTELVDILLSQELAEL